MSKLYKEEEMLWLSDIQHYCFCPRQWYLMTVEQIWEDNHLTIEGSLLHERVHQPEQSERRGNVVTLRSVPLASYKLGLCGFSDAIELHPSSADTGPAFVHPKYPGRWEAIPIEYKRGRPKRHNADKLQLCGQALCLEESYGINIPKGYIFYGETKRREEVPFSPELRAELIETAQKMHQAFASKTPIPAIHSSRCPSCSLLNQCIPKANLFGSASSYLEAHKLFML